MRSWSDVDEGEHQTLEVLFHFEKEAVTVKTKQIVRPFIFRSSKQNTFSFRLAQGKKIRHRLKCHKMTAKIFMIRVNEWIVLSYS